MTVHVTTTEDVISKDHQCSLREAMLYAMGNVELDCGPSFANGIVTINVPAGCYGISGGLLVILPSNSPVTLVAFAGAGAGPPGCDGGATVIDAEHTGSALTVGSAASARVSGVRLVGGSACAGGGGCSGGGVWNGGNLALNDVTIVGNAAAPGDDGTPGAPAGGRGGNGGGIFNDAGGQLTVTDSTIAGNAAGDGGAGADGVGNAGGDGGTAGEGGGIFNNGGSVALVDSTVSGNTGGAGGPGGLGDPTANPETAGGDGGPGGSGGGIVSVNGLTGTGRLSLTNVTVAGNSTGPAGGGAQGKPAGIAGGPGVGGGIASSSTLTLTNVTVTGNFGGGLGDGIIAGGALTTEQGSVIADNGNTPTAQNCAGGIANGGGNVTFPAQFASACPGAVADPKLGSLGIHGGAIATIPLGAGSAAIDAAGSILGCPGTDERGVPRPQGSGCDAGAYENAPPGVANVGATASGASTASIAVDVNAHLQDTSVVVRYGTSPAYGLASQTVDAGASQGTTSVSVPLTGLAARTTYHYVVVATNADGTTTSADQTLSVPAAGGPVLTNVRQAASRWLPGPALATIARKRRLPVGTTITFGLNEAAVVSLSFTQRVPGRVLNGHCVRPSKRTTRRVKCARVLSAGTLVVSGHSGADRIGFGGRLSRRRRLKPGTYTMTVVAANAAGQSSPHKLSFTIVSPR